MRILGFHHLAIQVRDVPRQLAFYRDVLGLPEMATHRRPDGSVRSVWLSLPEGFFALEACSGDAAPTSFRSSAPGLHVLALRISRADRAAWLEKLSSQSVPIVHQSRWTVYFQDPEGNRIALSHHPEDPFGESW